MSTLDDLTSRDSTRIWKACGTIRHLRDLTELMSLVDNIDVIRTATKNVPLGGMLRPNSSHLEFALRKLEFVRDGEGCFCKLYMLDDMFGPEREQESGNIAIIDTIKTADGFVDHYICRCVLCDQIYRVTEREYHYTWWKWEIEQNFRENDS
jgi:hypothetical protein